MDKAIVNRLKKIYQQQVLPKKSVTKGTPESSQSTIEVYNNYSVLRKRANEFVLKGGIYGEKE